MEENDYDSSIASLQVIGQRMRRELDAETRELVRRILEREVDADGALTLARELGLVARTRPKLHALLRGLLGPGEEQ